MGNLPEHPRLFANNARLASIKAQRDEVSQKLFFILQHNAESRLSAPKIAYNNDLNNMESSRNVQGRILCLALAYRLFGDKRFLAKAKEELLQLAALKDWGEGHFLDVGEASLAAGIGYDWLYNDLSVTERKTVAYAIKSKALVPALNQKEGTAGWVNGNFNWNPVCHGGLTVGALAIAESEPDLAKQIVDRATKNIPIAGATYAPDGAFPEGPSYWSYGTSFYVMAVEALRTALGNSKGLEKIPGFLQTAFYNNQMVAPSGDDYNYSDYHIEHWNEPVMLWFANEWKRKDVMKDELKAIDQLAKNNGAGLEAHRLMPFEILWWNPSLNNQKNEINPPLQWTAAGESSIGAMRSAWNDANATFVAIKGGTPNNSHGHMDVGSFILEADGVRWALDLGTEDYDKMRAAKIDLWNYSQTSTRWSTFRVGPEAHNILRFDNEYQLVAGNGKVKQLRLKNGTMGNEADLGSLYSNKVRSVTRKIILDADKSITFHDEWVANDTAVTVSFQWLTKAKVTKTKGGLLLQQDGKSLQIEVDKLSSISIDTEDESAAKNIQDSPNPGLSKISIKTKTAANSKGNFLLKAYPSTKMLLGKIENK